MNYKGVGAIFCLISALLTGARYLTAATYMSNTSTWSDELFQSGLAYTGSTLNVAAIATLVVGVLFLGYGIFRDNKKQDK